MLPPSSVFCFVTPCSVAVGYQRFGGPFCPQLQGYDLDKKTNINYIEQNSLFKFIIDVYICKINFHTFLCFCNNCVIIFKQFSSLAVGRGVTNPHNKNEACYGMLHKILELVGSCEHSKLRGIP
jgi:hypothetical protein